MRIKRDFIKENVYEISKKARHILSNRSGSGYIDVAIMLLISVVIGALLLSGLYTLFGDVVLPTITEKVREMFDYAG